MEPGSKILSPTNRNVSQTTGLAKFHLSPKRQGPTGRTHRSISGRDQAGSSINSKIQQFEEQSKKNIEDNENTVKSRRGTGKSQNKTFGSPFVSLSTLAPEKTVIDPEPARQPPNRNELLSKYAAKQAQLMELRKQQEVLEFEILEISAQLQKDVAQHASSETVFRRATSEVKVIKKKMSSLLQNTGETTNLRRTASTLFNAPAPLLNNELKKKASVLNKKLMADIREKLDQQQSEIEDFTRKGTEFARGLFSCLSPKKASPEPAIDSSFVLDNVVEGPVEESVILSDDDSEVLSTIDIDDYDSDASV